MAPNGDAYGSRLLVLSPPCSTAFTRSCSIACGEAPRIAGGQQRYMALRPAQVSTCSALAWPRSVKDLPGGRRAYIPVALARLLPRKSPGRPFTARVPASTRSARFASERRASTGTREEECLRRAPPFQEWGADAPQCAAGRRARGHRDVFTPSPGKGALLGRSSPEPTRLLASLRGASP